MSKERLNELSQELQIYDHSYYIKGKPIIDNTVYDGLYEELKYLEDKYKVPAYLKISNRVGVFNLLHDVPHLTKMYSMHKTSDMEQVHHFLSQFRFDTEKLIVDNKYDGIAIEVRYQNGVPVQAISRGDGITGKDITKNVFSCIDLPPNIPYKGTVQIEGEAVIAKTKDNQNTNLCSVVSGILMGKKPRSSKHITFMAYNYYIESNLNNRDYLTTLRTLSKVWKFKTTVCELVTWEDLNQHIATMEATKDIVPYPCDGVCIKINESNLRMDAGYTRKHARYQLAYKWEAPKHKTIIRSVKYQVANLTGRITPIVIIDPVYMNNKKFTRVNLHTFNKIQEFGVCIGSEIMVSIKGGLIPKLEEVLSKGTSAIEPPTNCPECNTPTIQKGKYIICPVKCQIKK